MSQDAQAPPSSTPTGVAPIRGPEGRVARLRRFNLLRYFTGAGLLIIMGVLLGSVLVAGRVIHDVSLEIEREEADSLVEDLLARMKYQGYGPERWGEPVLDPHLNDIVRAKLQNFGILEFSLYSPDQRELVVFTAHGKPRAAHRSEAFQEALSGTTSLRWQARYVGPLILLSGEGSSIDTYVPVKAADGHILGVAHLHRSLETVLPRTRIMLPRLALVAGTAALVGFLGLWLLVRHADRLIERQQYMIDNYNRQLSERNRLLEQYNERKDEFLAICSHDLRSPLNSIYAGCKILAGNRKGLLTPEQTEINAENLKKVSQMLHLIDSLLDLGRIEAGQEVVVAESFDLNTTLREVIAMGSAHAAERNVHIELEAAEGDPALVADVHKFRRIVSNVLSNAVKHSPKGGHVRVHAETQASWIRISISDQGPGIAPDQQALLFDKYSALARSKKTRSDGTGLGLAITNELVRLHGGRIEVESELGKGATFIVMLPRTYECSASAQKGTNSPA